MSDKPAESSGRRLTRRAWFNGIGEGLAAAALCRLLEQNGRAASDAGEDRPAYRTHPAKAKNVIFLFQHGGPSQLETFDYKPELEKYHLEEVPESVRGTQRLSGMSAGQLAYPAIRSPFAFARHGESGAWVSELLPHTAGIVDKLCIVRSMTTTQIDHGPATTFFQTGHQLPGRPSAGAWVSYGLGSESEDLPAYVALESDGKAGGSLPIRDNAWGAGFLPSGYQGVRFGLTGEPVPYLANPSGVDRALRRQTLDDIARLNRLRLAETGDPETEARIQQYEMAFRMQASVPELLDLSGESAGIADLYGDEVHEPGSYANHCLLARRLVERGVRFVQVFHRGWDAHFDIRKDLPRQCGQTDQPTAALIRDLEQRGLLSETLVVWTGEFGRTVFCQGAFTEEKFGRDHHGNCFSMWLAGGGVRPGVVYGQTDEFSYNVVDNPVSVHDLYATMLHQLGIDHTRLTYPFQSREYRLTDLYGRVVEEILA